MFIGQTPTEVILYIILYVGATLMSLIARHHDTIAAAPLDSSILRRSVPEPCMVVLLLYLLRRLQVCELYSICPDRLHIAADHHPRYAVCHASGP